MGLPKENKNAKLHTIADPSVQSVKGVVFMRKESFETRYVRARHGRDFVSCLCIPVVVLVVLKMT